MSDHDVLNQPPPLAGYDVYAADAVLGEAVRRQGGGWGEGRLGELGRLAGDPAWIDRGFAANENPPRLRTHDRFGHRIDEVHYHPAWHELMDVAVRFGLPGGPWAEPRPGARRAGTAVGKYWVCKRGPVMIGEALECLGGNGYVEESIMPRLYREAPVNSVWEGSGNVNVLDVLRVLAREPQTAEAFVAEIGRAAGGDARLDAHAKRLRDQLATLPAELAQDSAGVQRNGRRLVGAMALALQGALLVRHAPAVVADAFCASRLDDRGAGRAYGDAGTAVPASAAAAIIERHTPIHD